MTNNSRETPRVEFPVSEMVSPINTTDGPYLMESITRVLLSRRWNPMYNQDAVCVCGDPYHRHFDPYEDMNPVGCKYCDCFIFTPRE